MRRLILSLGFLLALSACNTVTPSSPDQMSSSLPAVASSSVPLLDAMTMLDNTQLPDGWKALPGGCGNNVACVYSQKTYTGTNHVVDHDFMIVQTTTPNRCDAAYAKTQSAQDGSGEDTSKPFIVEGENMGYIWSGFAGAGVMPGDTPNMRYVCIRHARQNLDIIISAFTKDTSTLNYIDTVFIPFWIKQN